MLKLERRRIGLVGMSQTIPRLLSLESSGRKGTPHNYCDCLKRTECTFTHKSTHREIRHAIMPMTIEDVRHVKMGEPDCSGKVCA